MSRSHWEDFPWRLVHAEPHDPLVHLALDEVLTDAVGAGRSAPTLRFWEFERSCAVIGRFQSLRNEIDAEGARREGIEVVRRISGGGAMFMESGSCVTYSIHAPASLVEGMSFRESYAFFDQWVIDGLREVGVDAWYQPLNDMTSKAGKIGGAAQARRKNAVLHHVTMAYDIDADKMLRVLRIGREKLSDKGVKSAVKRVDPLRRQTGLPRATIIERLMEAFRAQHGGTRDTLTATELAAANALVTRKFSTPEWLATVR